MKMTGEAPNDTVLSPGLVCSSIMNKAAALEVGFIRRKHLPNLLVSPQE